MNETDYSKYTVLVVDDIPVNILLVKGMLSRFKFNIMSANSGKEALELMTRSLPDIILMDVMMPGMNGFETTRAIRSNSNTSHIPVIILSALNSDADIKEGLEAGANDFITKPFIQERIINSIANQITLSERNRTQNKAEAERETGYENMISLLAYMANKEGKDAELSLIDTALCLPLQLLDKSLYALTGHSSEMLTEWIEQQLAQMEVKSSKVSVSKCLSYVKGIMNPVFGQRNILLKSDIREKMEADADPSLLNAILTNLLSLACRKVEKEIAIKGYVDGGLANIVISFATDAAETQEIDRRTHIAMEAASRMNGAVLCETEDGRCTFHIILQL